jgi:hypothetical protein
MDMEVLSMPTYVTIAVLTAWAALGTSLSIAMAADPSAEALITLAPIVRSDDAKYNRIDIEGYMNGDEFMLQVFRVRYRAPDQYSLYLIDGVDNTPIVYLNNNQLIIYNAIDGSVMYLSRARFDYSFRFEEGKFNHRFQLARSTEQSRILLDVKSLYDRHGVGDSVARSGGGMFRVTRKLEGGKSFVAFIDPSRQCPFSQVALMKIGTDDPFIHIREILVNGDARAAWPNFPTKDLLAGKVDLKDRTSSEQHGVLSVMEYMDRSLLARPAIRNESIRETFEQRHGVKVDWKKAEGNDRRTSRTIREIMSGDAAVKLEPVGSLPR